MAIELHFVLRYGLCASHRVITLKLAVAILATAQVPISAALGFPTADNRPHGLVDWLAWRCGSGAYRAPA